MKHCALCLLKTDNEIWLMLNDDKSIKGWNTVAEALQYWTSGYKRKHRQSYEGSMSACIAFVTVQPSIIWVPEDSDWLQNHLISKADNHVYSCRNIAIHFYGVKTSPEAETLWENGSFPSLI